MSLAIFGSIVGQTLAVPGRRLSPDRQLQEMREQQIERMAGHQTRQCLNELDVIRGKVDEAKACFTLAATPEQKLQCLEKALNK